MEFNPEFILTEKYHGKEEPASSMARVEGKSMSLQENVNETGY